MAARRTRPTSDILVKQFRLSAKDASILLASQSSQYSPRPDFLLPYYAGLQSIKSDLEKYRLYYAISLLVLFLVQIGGLDEAEVFGVSTKPEILKHISLLFVSFLTLAYSYYQAKMLRFDGIFQAFFDRSDQNDRQDLILRYPQAYSALLFDRFISGRPAYMFAKRNSPIRLVILLVLMIPALIAMLSFTVWLIGSVCVDLWNFRSDTIGAWSRILVSASVSLLAFSILLPTISVFSRDYQHFGLANLLARLRDKDEIKHERRISQISAAMRRMEQSR